MPGLIDQEPTAGPLRQDTGRTQAQRRLNITRAQFAIYFLLHEDGNDNATEVLDRINDPNVLAAVAQAAETLARMCRQRIEQR